MLELRSIIAGGSLLQQRISQVGVAGDIGRQPLNGDLHGIVEVALHVRQAAVPVALDIFHHAAQPALENVPVSGTMWPLKKVEGARWLSCTSRSSSVR